jgi:hypothetical protein
VALPQDEAHVLEAGCVVAAADLLWIPHDHLLERHAHLPGGVAPEMLVWHEEDAAPARPCPFERRLGVARGADGPAALADERLDGRRRVDVGDRHHVGDAHGLELTPANLELLDVGHVGHRTPGGQVRQRHLLVVGAEDVGALGHEVNAAEHDVFGLCAGFALARQLPRIADDVGVDEDLVALVVVAEDEEAVAEGLLGRPDPLVHLLETEAKVAFRQRLALRKAGLLVLGQDLDIHAVPILAPAVYTGALTLQEGSWGKRRIRVKARSRKSFGITPQRRAAASANSTV